MCFLINYNFTKEKKSTISRQKKTIYNTTIIPQLKQNYYKGIFKRHPLCEVNTLAQLRHTIHKRLLDFISYYFLHACVTHNRHQEYVVRKLMSRSNLREKQITKQDTQLYASYSIRVTIKRFHLYIHRSKSVVGQFLFVVHYSLSSFSLFCLFLRFGVKNCQLLL